MPDLISVMAHESKAGAVSIRREKIAGEFCGQGRALEDVFQLVPQSKFQFVFVITLTIEKGKEK